MKKRLFIYWICWTWRTTSMSRSWWPHKIRSEVVWQRRRLKGWHWRSFLHSNVYVYSVYLMYCSKEVGISPKVELPFIDIFHRRLSGSGVRPPRKSRCRATVTRRRRENSTENSQLLLIWCRNFSSFFRKCISHSAVLHYLGILNY